MTDIQLNTYNTQLRQLRKSFEELRPKHKKYAKRVRFQEYDPTTEKWVWNSEFQEFALSAFGLPKFETLAYDMGLEIKALKELIADHKAIVKAEEDRVERNKKLGRKARMREEEEHGHNKPEGLISGDSTPEQGSTS